MTRFRTAITSLTLFTAVCVLVSLTALPQANLQSAAFCNAPFGFTPISTVQEFQNIGNNSTGKFALCSDLNFSGTGWTPLLGFAGELDGNSHTISGVALSMSSSNNVGIFATIVGGSASVRNLTIRDSYFLGNTNVGALAGSIAGASRSSYVGVQNVQLINNFVSCTRYCGGLVGAQTFAQILNVTGTNLTVSGVDYAGGIAGASNQSQFYLLDITASSAPLGISGGTAVGGIVGYSYLDVIYQSKTYGDILVSARPVSDVNPAPDAAGGLAGQLNTGSVMESTSAAVLQASRRNSTGGAYAALGGLVGRLGSDNYTIDPNSNGAITDSSFEGEILDNASVSSLIMGGVAGVVHPYARLVETLSIGIVHSRNSSGGIFGSNSAFSTTIYNNAFLKDAGTSENTGLSSQIGVVPLTWSQMGDAASFDTWRNWGVPSVSNFNDGSCSMWEIDQSVQVRRHPLISSITAKDPVCYATPVPTPTFTPSPTPTPWAGTGCEVPPGFKPIRTVAELKDINNHLGDNYSLCADLDLSGELNWQPIGPSWSSLGGFSGTLNGYGHTISNLTINSPDKNYVGLFENIRGSVSNLKLVNFNLTGKYSVAALAANLFASDGSASVSNIDIDSTINCKSYCGGAVGQLNNGSMSNIKVTTEVLSSEGYIVSGLVGASYGPSAITDVQVFTKGSGITGTTFLGGIIGNANGAGIRRAFFKGALSCQAGVLGQFIGGITGHHLYSDTGLNYIEQSESQGSINCPELDGIGGVFGQASKSPGQPKTNISDVLSSMTVVGRNYVGEIGGASFAQVTHALSLSLDGGKDRFATLDPLSHFGSDAGVASGVLSLKDLGAPGTQTKNCINQGECKGLIELKQRATYAGWDISDVSDPQATIWKFVDGIPRLRWTLAFGDITAPPLSFNPVAVDCAGAPGGSMVNDSCGVCGGDGTSCRACQTTSTFDRVSAVKMKLASLSAIIKSTISLGNGSKSPALSKMKKSLLTRTDSLIADSEFAVQKFPQFESHCSELSVCTSKSLADLNALFSSTVQKLSEIEAELVRKLGKGKNKAFKKKLASKTAAMKLQASAALSLIAQLPQATDVCA